MKNKIIMSVDSKMVDISKFVNSEIDFIAGDLITFTTDEEIIDKTKFENFEFYSATVKSRNWNFVSKTLEIECECNLKRVPFSDGLMFV